MTQLILGVVSTTKIRIICNKDIEEILKEYLKTNSRTPFFFFQLLLYWWCIVTFTKVLTICPR
jgi:hypothetical protein